MPPDPNDISNLPPPQQRPFHSQTEAKGILFLVVEDAQIIIACIKMGCLAARYHSNVCIILAAYSSSRRERSTGGIRRSSP